MERQIVHMDMDTFFVSCERLRNPKLNNVPLIIGGGERGIVTSCSYEALKYGIHSAMPVRMAGRLCPDARMLRGDIDYYSKLSHIVTEIINEKAPVMEKATLSEFYLDITGMDKFYGGFKWTNELAATVIKETGLPVSFALSVNKTVSKIASGESKPTGRIEILQPQVQPFLDPLSVHKIPMIGDATFKVLSRMGIRTIKTLSEIPEGFTEKILGKNGGELWRKANGIDNAPVEPYTEKKSISAEITLDNDTIDIVKVKALFTGMVEKLAFQLRTEGWLTSIVTVKIRYSNLDTETRQTRISYTAADHNLLKIILGLFDKLYTRRMRLRLVGIRFSGLVRGSNQVDLFEDTVELMALYQAMDKMKTRFGPDAVSRCSGASLKPSEHKSYTLYRKDNTLGNVS